jgi:hypothetical protein
MTDTTSNVRPRLQQPWLTIARLIWLVFRTPQWVLLILSLPAYYAQLGTSSSSFLGPDWSHETFLEALAVLHLSVTAYSTIILASDLFRILVFTAIASLIFWRKSDEWLGLFASYVLFGIGWAVAAGRLTGFDALPILWQQILSIPLIMIWPCLFIFLNIYPDGRHVPAWTRLITLSWLVFGLYTALQDFGAAATPGWINGVFSVLLLVGFGAQIYRYVKVSGLLERLQMRWFIFSIAIFVAVQLIGQQVVAPLFSEVGPERLMFRLVNHSLGNVIFTLIPISIGIALFRYRLWELDIIIRRTLIYSTITALLAGVFFGGVVLLQNLFLSIVGQQSPLAVVVSTLVTFVLFAPLRRRVQNFVDRRFYRQKYDAQKTLEAFAVTMRDEVDMETLKAQLISVVNDTMQPASISLWVRED